MAAKQQSNNGHSVLGSASCLGPWGSAPDPEFALTVDLVPGNSGDADSTRNESRQSAPSHSMKSTAAARLYLPMGQAGSIILSGSRRTSRPDYRLTAPRFGHWAISEIRSTGAGFLGGEKKALQSWR